MHRHTEGQSEHLRTQFQIDRIAFFSDAVIAIAITLMILEVKIPPLGANTSFKEIIDKYGGSFLVHFGALFICFISVGNLWIRHHELYEHIIKYNKSLIKANLYFLLTIMLLPISISFLFTNDNPLQLKMILFFVNLCLCNFTYFIMLRIIFHSRNNFYAVKMDEHTKRNMLLSLYITITFAVVSVLVAFNIKWFYMPFILWWVARRAWFIVLKIRNKKHVKKPPLSPSEGGGLSAG